MPRVKIAQVADVVALGLFTYVLWRMFFGADEMFQFAALAAGSAGLAAAALSGGTVRTPIDVPVLAYLGLCILSTAVNYARYEPLPHMTVWQPTVLTAILVVYFYGVAALLERRTRLTILVTGLVAAAR